MSDAQMPEEPDFGEELARMAVFAQPNFYVSAFGR